MVRSAGGSNGFRPELVKGVFIALVLVGMSGCFWENGGTGVEIVPAMEREQVRGMDQDVEVMLTKEVEELRRVRGEHEKLISTIPTAEPEKEEDDKDEAQREAVAKIIHNPDGLAFVVPADEDWFDPEKGLEFFRSSGGDWTNPIVRRKHSHRLLFYHEGYPDDVPNFADKSIYRGLARELAFGAAEAMPLLGDPTPALVGAIEDRLGWALRSSEGPVVNVWSWLSLKRGREWHDFAVGGVMRMEVGSRGEGEDAFEYLKVGSWLGPVVVERLR